MHVDEKKGNIMLAVFGGTFDPVHYGHLRVALELCQQLPIEQLRFVPCQNPVSNKTAIASMEQRLAMLRLAIQDQQHWVVDEREIKRKTKSYTIDTLVSLRAENQTQSLSFIMGSDALNQLHTWQCWEQLLQYAHLVVLPRPDSPLPSDDGVIAKFIRRYRTQNKQVLQQNLHGFLFVANVTPLAIASTAIRQQFADKQLSPRYLLPDVVFDYIQQQKLYSLLSPI